MEGFALLLVAFLALAIGSILGYLARRTIAKAQLGSIEAKIEKLLADARAESQNIILAAREKAAKAVEESKKEEKERVLQFARNEEKLLKREEMVDRHIFEYEKKEEIRFKKKVPKKYLTPNTKKAISTVMIIFTLLFIFYFGYQLKLLFSSPHVDILSPKKTVFSREEFIELVGKTDKETIITVNGEKIIPDKNSIFKTKVPLPEVVNKVIIEVTGANGRKTVLIKYYERKN